MFHDLEKYESRRYSQNGEDGILTRLFELLGVTNRFFVEFGTGPDGRERNTRLLEQQGWSGLLMDVAADARAPHIQKEQITAENINALFARYEVPAEFDLLCIDIDGNDYWVWKALNERYRPRVMVLEYNAAIPASESKTIAYDPHFRWSRTDYFGASLRALAKLAAVKGYKLVYCELRGINSFWVRADLAPDWNEPAERLYRGPDYARGKVFGLARLYWPRGVGHRKDRGRRMVDV